MQQAFLQIGPIKLYFYGFFIILGLLFLYVYSKRNAKEFNLKEKLVENTFFVILISSLVGGRIYHVLSQLAYYKVFSSEIFYIWQGGLGIFGAILGSILSVFIYSKVAKFSFLDVLNLFSPPLLLTQAIGRLGNYYNLEVFGFPTSLPWGIYIPITKRPLQFVNDSFFHPTFFYESLLCLIAFFLFLIAKKRMNKKYFFSFYLISYGLIRFFTESLRMDTWTFCNIKAGHLLSLAFIITGFFFIFKHRNKKISLKVY